MSENIEPGRCYYEKRVGWHWEVWFCRSDNSADPSSGATEWKASSVKYWRWINAARCASAMWSQFNDGVWIEGGRHADKVRWKCGAAQRHILPDGQDCDWPVCGCDPYASKVLDAISESGFEIVPSHKPGEAIQGMTIQQIRALAEKMLDEAAAEIDAKSKIHQ